MKFPKTPVLLATVLTFCLSQSLLNAQLSETRLTQFVGANDAIIINFNLAKVVENVDKDSEHFKYLNKLMIEETGMDLSRTKTLFSTLPLDPEPDEERYESIMNFNSLAIEFDNGYDLDSFIAKRFEYYQDKVTINDDWHEYRLHEVNEDWEHFSLCTINDAIIILGHNRSIKSRIDGIESHEQRGARVLTEINLDAPFSMAMDLTELDERSKENFGAIMSDLFIGLGAADIAESIRTLNVQIDLDSDQPLIAQAEMSSSEAAEKFKSLVRAGILLAPSGIGFIRDSLSDENFYPEANAISLEDGLDSLEDILDNIEVKVDGGNFTITVEKKGGYPEGYDQLASAMASVSYAQQKMMEQWQSEWEESAEIIDDADFHDHDDDHDHDHEDDDDDDN